MVGDEGFLLKSIPRCQMFSLSIQQIKKIETYDNTPFQRVVFYFVQHQAREDQPVCLDKMKVSFFLCYVLFTLEPRSKLVISHF